MKFDGSSAAGVRFWLEERIEIAKSMRTPRGAPFPQLLHDGFAVEQVATPRRLEALLDLPLHFTKRCVPTA